MYNLLARICAFIGLFAIVVGVIEPFIGRWDIATYAIVVAAWFDIKLGGR